MISISKFMEYVTQYEIPPSGPIMPGVHERAIDDYLARKECNERGMWAIVDMEWTQHLAEWIGNKNVLEVMSGAGWLAQALSLHGTKIIATDNGEWDARHSKMKFLFPVEKIVGKKAVTKYKEAEIMLVSWPPYGEKEIVKICKAWGSTRPIIYIGEGSGGCNAPDEFFHHFYPISVDIPLPQWVGLHDYVSVGYYR